MQFQLLNFQQTNPMLAGLQEGMKSNDYLADAISKMQQARYAGLQPLATLSANPYMWANPGIQQGLMQAIGQFLPGAAGQSQGQSSAGTGGSGGGGGSLWSSIFGGGNSGGSAPASPSGGNAPISPANNGSGAVQSGSSTSPNLLPTAGQNLGGKIQGNVTTPFNEQKVGKGVFNVNPVTGAESSSPAEGTITSQQLTQVGLKNAYPLLDKIASEQKEFLDQGGKTKLDLASISGQLNNRGFNTEGLNKVLNIDPEMLSRFGKLTAHKNTLIDTLVKAYGLNQSDKAYEMTAHIVDPIPGEPADGYKSRVLDQMNDLATRYRQNQDLLSGGLSTQIPLAANQPGFNPQVSQQLGTTSKNKSSSYAEGKEPPNDSVWMTRPDGQIVPVHKSRVEEAKKYKFKEVG